MPHKRAKQSARLKERNELGQDLVPQKGPLSNEPIPKGAARVLNAVSIRDEYKKKKRSLDQDSNVVRSNKKAKLDNHDKLSKNKRQVRVTANMTIKPGESIQHFNNDIRRRVEDDMRPLVKAAVQSSNAALRVALRTEKQEKVKKVKNKDNTYPENKQEMPRPARMAPSAYSDPPDKHVNKPKEFEKHSSSTPKRLNDIVQAPPEFNRLPRGATTLEQGFTNKREGVLSMAQKQMLAIEREKVVAKYRQMKARQRQAAGEGADQK